MYLKSGVKGSKKKDNTSASAPIAAKTEIEWQKPSVYPETLRDPMKKSSTLVKGITTTEPAGGNVVVRGIVWSEDNPAAIIGTQVIYQGQVVDGVAVVKINQDSVEFEKDGQTWVQKVEY